MKTLNDFKQEVAEEYGLESWTWELEDYCDEAAERYAEYKSQVVADDLQLGYVQGWNEGLQWALESIDENMGAVMTFSELKATILKGLK